jgi:putative DNA primase/helicase
LPTAQAYVAQFHQHDDGRTIHSYASNLRAWRNNRYSEIEEESLKQNLQPWLHDCLQYKAHKDGTVELVPYESNPGTIKSAVESIRAYIHLPATITPTAWLDGRIEPSPLELLPTPSGNLHIPTGRLYLPTPLLFNVNAIEFEHDPHAPPPQVWLAFLDALWANDLETIDCLQEIFGYLLVADTSQQKIFLFAGPKRSGKGTIARVLTRLVGAGNVVGPTTSSLAGPFGLQPLIGKSVAIVSDARFTGESVGIVVERLLCISGEDTLTVDIKFKASITAKLGARFLFLSNELPKMNDASGALAGRFIVLRLTQSFYGREDTALIAKLLAELPGILNWAITGLKRLRRRGRFVQPSSAADAIREMEDLGSPIGAFVRDCCEVTPTKTIPTAELFSAWQSWCKSQGRDRPGTIQTFGRDLRAAVAGIKVIQPNEDGVRTREYQGINLNAKTRADIAAEVAAAMSQANFREHHGH